MEKPEEDFTKSLFFSPTLREKFVPKYFGNQIRSQLPSLPFIEEMLSNHRRCPYWTLLRKICPCSLDFRSHPKRKRKTSITISDSVPHQKVFLYVRRIFLIIVPLNALGTTSNVNVFLKHVYSLLSLPASGKISLSFMMDNLKTKVVDWLKPFSQAERLQKLRETIQFLILSFIGPLVQSLFRVTQAPHTCELSFYRKKIWQHLVQVAFKAFTTKCKLQPVSENWFENERNCGRCLGVSPSNFILTKTSLRPVVKCSMRENGRVSVNDHLKMLHLVLSHEYKSQTLEFGASILGMDELHKRWVDYVLVMKKKHVRRYYFVRTDLVECFDNIDLKLAYDLVRTLMDKTASYTIYKYRKIIAQRLTDKYKYFESLETPDNICKSASNTTCVDSFTVSKDVLLEKLHALLFCNIVKFGRNHFMQTLGISQGSCISSILCALYFGNLDKTILMHVLDRHSFLVRLTDDMLYVTPHKEKAKSFLQLMLDGVPSVNCVGKFKKTCANFSYTHQLYGQVQLLSEAESVRYCGICIDPATHEVSFDQSNYSEKTIKRTISWSLSDRPGLVLKQKMFKSFQPKCYSILFDSRINSQKCIENNALNIFAVCSLKFHYLVMKLPAKRRANSNPKFFASIILDLPKQFRKFVNHKLRAGLRGKELPFPISVRLLESMCNHTFLFTLKRHHSIYSLVIDRLKKIEKKKGLCRDITKRLPEIFKNFTMK